MGVKINGKSSATFIREQFLMVYHDPYGGIWRTDAIDGHTNNNIAASRVQDAKYSSNFCEHSHTELAPATDDMDFTIEFANLPGQTGVQYLFEVDVSKRGAGAFPMSGGITG